MKLRNDSDADSAKWGNYNLSERLKSHICNQANKIFKQNMPFLTFGIYETMEIKIYIYNSWLQKKKKNSVPWKPLTFFLLMKYRVHWP